MAALLRGVALAAAWSAMNVDAVQVFFDQDTEPTGFFTPSSVEVTAPTNVVTALAPLTSSGYSFTHWTLNGVRQQDLTGRALNPVRFVIYEYTDAVAHYTNSLADADSDGVPDWFEMLYYGTVTNALTGDTDNDGFNLQEEYLLDTDPLLPDNIVAGGISRRRSTVATVILSSSYALYTETSTPPGFAARSMAVATGTVVKTSSFHGDTTGYTFGYWDINGVRQADPCGMALNQASITITGVTVATAHFFPTLDDTDGNGLPDWWQILYLGATGNQPTADPDADGYTQADEFSREANPLLPDRIVAGGISRRRSDVTLVNLADFYQYDIHSSPLGLITAQSGAAQTGTVIRTQNLSGLVSGYMFGYWTVNGARQADFNGRARSQVVATLTTDLVVVANYFPQLADTDGDGLPDWWEWNQLGTLSSSPTDDPDGDGYTLAVEYANDTQPLLSDRIVSGGISRRRADLIAVNLQGFEHVQYVLVDGVLSNFFPYWPTDTTGRPFGTNATPAVGDWDGDGVPDLFVGSSSGQLTIFKNLGTAHTWNLSERTAVFSALASAWNTITNPAPALGDWDGNGRADLAIGGNAGRVRLMASTGTFSGPQAPAVNYDLVITNSSLALPAFIKLPGRAKLDLLVLLDDGTVRQYLNTGNASQPFTADQATDNLLGTAVPQGTGLSAADVNHDGYPDILVTDAAGRTWEFDGNAAGGFVLKNKVWAGTGAGFAQRMTLAPADLDSDGDIDGLFGSASGKLVWLRDPALGRPGNVQAFGGVDSTRVTWDPNRETKFRGDCVYRAANTNGTFAKVATNLIATTEFLDLSTGSGLTWYYYVTAVSTFMQPGSTKLVLIESPPSEIAAASNGVLQLTTSGGCSPAGTTTVVSIYLSNARNVIGNGLALHLLYNPAQIRPASQVLTNLATVQRSQVAQSIAFADNSATASGELVIQGSGTTPLQGEGRMLDTVWMVAAGLPGGVAVTCTVSAATLYGVGGRTLAVDIGAPAVVTIQTTYIRGDVNGDGEISQDDFVLAMKLAVGQRAPTAQELLAGDLNGNGVIDKDDAQLILRMVHGKDVNPK